MVGTCQGVVSLGVLGQLFGNVEAGVVATKEGKKVSVVAHQLKRNTLRTDQGGIRVIPIKFAHILSLPVLCNSGAKELHNHVCPTPRIRMNNLLRTKNGLKHHKQLVETY